MDGPSRMWVSCGDRDCAGGEIQSCHRYGRCGEDNDLWTGIPFINSLSTGRRSGSRRRVPAVEDPFLARLTRRGQGVIVDQKSRFDGGLRPVL